MNLSENLKFLRQSANLTQKELAKKLGIGQSTIVGYERGEREATVTNLVKYAEFFNESLDALCGIKQNIYSHSTPTASTALSHDDKKLLDAYHSLEPKLRSLLWDMLETWQKNSASLSETDQKKA